LLREAANVLYCACGYTEIKDRKVCRCYGCSVLARINAALGEPDMTKIAEAFKRTGDGVTVQVDEQPCATCGGHKLVKAPVLGILVSCPSCGEQAGGAE